MAAGSRRVGVGGSEGAGNCGLLAGASVAVALGAIVLLRRCCGREFAQGPRGPLRCPMQSAGAVGIRGAPGGASGSHAHSNRPGKGLGWTKSGQTSPGQRRSFWGRGDVSASGRTRHWACGTGREPGTRDDRRDPRSRVSGGGLGGLAFPCNAGWNLFCGMWGYGLFIVGWVGSVGFLFRVVCGGIGAWLPVGRLFGRGGWWAFPGLDGVGGWS